MCEYLYESKKKKTDYKKQMKYADELVFVAESLIWELTDWFIGVPSGALAVSVAIGADLIWVMNECFDLGCRRLGLKRNAGKSKVIIFGEDGTLCDVAILGACLEWGQSFKYLGCVLNESGTDEADI